MLPRTCVQAVVQALYSKGCVAYAASEHPAGLACQDWSVTQARCLWACCEADLRDDQALAALSIVHRHVQARAEEVLMEGRHNVRGHHRACAAQHTDALPAHIP